MKEQGKNLGNQPEKEFRGMVINMIQNLGNRMEAWIKKIQEMFNKDPKELKNTQWWATQLKWKIHWKESMQNNWEEWISKLEEQMLEIITEEQNKEKKNEKKWGQSHRPLGHYWTQQHSNYRGLRRRKEKGSEKIFEEIGQKPPQHEKGNSHPSPGSTETSLFKETNPMRITLRHILVKLTKIEFKENIKSSKGTAKNNTQGNPQKVVIRWFCSRNCVGQKGVARYI